MARGLQGADHGAAIGRKRGHEPVMLIARVEENQAAPPSAARGLDEHGIAVLGHIDGYQ